MATGTPHTPSDQTPLPPPPPPISTLRTAITSGYVEIVSSSTASDCDGREAEGASTSGQEQAGTARSRRDGGSRTGRIEIEQSQHQRHRVPQEGSSGVTCSSLQNAQPVATTWSPNSATSLPGSSTLETLASTSGCLDPGYDRLAPHSIVTGSGVSEADSEHLTNSTGLELPVIIVTESSTSTSAE